MSSPVDYLNKNNSHESPRKLSTSSPGRSRSNSRGRHRSDLAPPHSVPSMSDSPRGPHPLYHQSRSVPEPSTSAGAQRTPLYSPGQPPSGYGGARSRTLSESGVESADSFDSIHCGPAGSGDWFEYLSPAPTATVIHAYEPQEDDELCLEIGDTVHVLSKDARDSGADGWWVGVRQVPLPPVRSSSISSPSSPPIIPVTDLSAQPSPAQQMGIFPCNYVVFMDGGTVPSVTQIDAHGIELHECVGSGGFGEVRVGTWKTRGGIAIAVKTLITDRTSDVLALEREARYLCMCRHPNIVTMYGLTQLDATKHALVMDFAKGGALNQLLARRPILSPAVLLDWAMQIARGMKYLHEDAPARIYHRDLKSSNVLIRDPVTDNDNLQGKTLLITDFGLARSIHEEFFSREDAAVYLCDSGTYAWMSPEAVQGQIEYSAKSDIWSYGVLLWELLTGDVPYKNMEPCHVIYSVGNGKCGLFVPDDCPDIFRELLRDCWHRNPDMRPSFRTILERLAFARDGAFMQIPASTLYEQQKMWREKIGAMTLSSFSEPEPVRRMSQDSITSATNDSSEYINAREERLLQRELEIEARREQLSVLERSLVSRQRALEQRETELLLHVSMQAWPGPTRPAPPPKRPAPSGRRLLLFRRNKPASLQIGKPSSVVHVLHVSNTPEDGSPRLRVIKNPEPLKGHTWGPSVTSSKNRRSSLNTNHAKNLAKSAPNLQKYPPVAETEEKLSPELQKCPSCYFRWLDGAAASAAASLDSACSSPMTCSKLAHRCRAHSGVTCSTSAGTGCVSFFDWFLRRLTRRSSMKQTERQCLHSGLLLAAVGLGCLASCPVDPPRARPSPRRRDAYYAALGDGYLRGEDVEEEGRARRGYRPGYATVGHTVPASMRPSILASSQSLNPHPRTVTFERPSNLDLVAGPSPSPPSELSQVTPGQSRRFELPQPTTPSDSTGYGSTRATPRSPLIDAGTSPSMRILRQLAMSEDTSGDDDRFCTSQL